MKKILPTFVPSKKDVQSFEEHEYNLEEMSADELADLQVKAYEISYNFGRKVAMEYIKRVYN